MGFPYGKLNPAILESIVFRYLGARRSDVVLGPSRGEDAAILKVGDELIAASCDPISGSVRNVGWLAVNVSANDVATRGVRPRWFFSCILLPKNSKAEVLEEICRQMDLAAKRLGVAIVGGHSEVSPGLSHPIVIGFCVGKVEGSYVRSGGAKPGGKIILTKGAGIEGTGILATDKEEVIAEILGRDVAERGKKYLERVSVVTEAMEAFNFGGVQAMHDPTEGGVIGGLCELADAANLGFKVSEGEIPIGEETAAICKLFKIDPLRLISSGSLLIIVDREKAEGVVHELKNLGIEASLIGEMLEDANERYLLTKDGKKKNVSMPEADELWKVVGR